MNSNTIEYHLLEEFMRVTYCDDLGYINVDIDDGDVDFIDGYAYFRSNFQSYKIPINDIVCISVIDN